MIPNTSLVFLTDIFVPIFGLLLDKLLHQVVTLFVVQNNHFNTPLFQVLLAAYKRLVFANNDSFDLVHDTGTGTHVAWAQGGVHGSTTVR
jgi:hypothetical protein